VSLATNLRNIPELANVPADAIKPAIHWWWEQSAPHMMVRDWPKVWKRWQFIWNGWAKPEIGAAWRARDIVVGAPLPDAALIYQKPGKQLLVALCFAMQAEAGGGVWYLSCRTAADILTSVGHEVDYTTVSRWLRSLIRDGVLVRPYHREPGSLKAQRYQVAEAAARQKLVMRAAG
jgi:hypothetical protein